MTVKNFGMMVIGMMMIGTTTVFGKTNTTVNNDRHGKGRTEVVVITNHDRGHMGDRHMRGREMDRFMMKHMMEGRHIFGRHGECKVCHMDKHEIMKFEREMRHNAHRPMVKTSHFGR